MQNTGTAPDTHDANELEAQALEHEAEAAKLRARALRLKRIEALPVPEIETKPQSTKNAAIAVNLSPATLRRFAPEAPAGVLAGGTAALRWNVPALRTWLASRGRKPALAKREVTADDDICVTEIARRAGLRVGGSR